MTTWLLNAHTYACGSVTYHYFDNIIAMVLLSVVYSKQVYSFNMKQSERLCNCKLYKKTSY